MGADLHFSTLRLEFGCDTKQQPCASRRYWIRNRRPDRSRDNGWWLAGGLEKFVVAVACCCLIDRTVGSRQLWGRFYLRTRSPRPDWFSPHRHAENVSHCWSPKCSSDDWLVRFNQISGSTFLFFSFSPFAWWWPFQFQDQLESAGRWRARIIVSIVFPFSSVSPIMIAHF